MIYRETFFLFRPECAQAGSVAGMAVLIVGSRPAASRVKVSTVMSSSWPKRCAALAIAPAGLLAMAAVRSNPKSSPCALQASTTPSEMKVSESPWASWRAVSVYSAWAAMPRGRRSGWRRRGRCDTGRGVRRWRQSGRRLRRVPRTGRWQSCPCGVVADAPHALLRRNRDDGLRGERTGHREQKSQECGVEFRQTRRAPGKHGQEHTPQFLRVAGILRAAFMRLRA